LIKSGFDKQVIQLSGWLSSPPELFKLKTPPAALPGANLLPDLINSGFDKQVLTNRFRSTYIKGGCDLTRGTRGKAHPQPAFEVAHLAAGGLLFQLVLCGSPNVKHKRNPNMKFRPFILVWILALCMAGTASAHTLFMSAYDNEDGTVTVEGIFSTGAAASSVEIRLEDKNGKTILKEKLDELGEYTFTQPSGAYDIVLDAGPGHLVRKNGPEKTNQK